MYDPTNTAHSRRDVYDYHPESAGASWVWALVACGVLALIITFASFDSQSARNAVEPALPDASAATLGSEPADTATVPSTGTEPPAAAGN